MPRVLSLGRKWSGCDAVVVGFAVTLAAACGDDTVLSRRPNPAQDGAVPGGQAGDDSGAGGSQNNGGASNGGRNSTGGRAAGGGTTTNTPCTNSLDCASNEVCDRAAGYCVECAADSDCTTPGLRCVGQHCRAPCTSDRQCTPQRLLCNLPLGVCTQCTNDSDCAASQSCQVGNCVGSTSAGTGGAGGVTSSGGAGGVIANGGVSNGGAGGVSNGGVGGVSNGGAGGVLGTGGAGPTCNRADLWIALDQSGSMGNTFDVGTRWEVFRSGVQGFATTATRAAAGIVMFPKAGTGVPASCCVDADCGAFGPCTPLVPGFTCPTFPGTCAGAAGCQTSSYDAVDVPLTPLPDTSNVFATFLASVSPLGSSTLAPALERMRLRAIASANANPSNRTAMVLVTDGAPGGCTPGNTIPDVANVATAALAGSPSIKTYVVTVGIDPATMAPVAAAGGTTIFGVPTTATLGPAIDYVRTSLVQIAAELCK